MHAKIRKDIPSTFFIGNHVIKILNTKDMNRSERPSKKLSVKISETGAKSM